MAAHGAFRLGRMVDNLNRILGVELLCAAQGIEFRAPLKTSTPLQACVERLRQNVPSIAEDRYLAPDLETAGQLVASGELARVAGVEIAGPAA